MIRPDFREIKHSELYHFGVSKKNGAPGPGSGRYPLGSGDRPFQSEKTLDKKNNDRHNRYVKKALGVVGALSIAYAGYKFSQNEHIRNILYKAISKVSDQKIITSENDLSYIFSKSLGRMLTIKEAMDMGFI